MIRLRLIKVIVQPILVTDDGESLKEFKNSPSEIPASQLANLPVLIEGDIARTERSLNGET